MRTKLILSLLLVVSTNAFAGICLKSDIDSAVSRATARASYDKNLHCSVSCQLTLKCGSVETFMIGLGKEVKDAFRNIADAERADLKADLEGISFVRDNRARTVADCFRLCDTYYVPNR